jgi:hypothetical protein
MADTIVKKFVIDTSESEQNLKELNTQLKATGDAANDAAESLDATGTAAGNAAGGLDKIPESEKKVVESTKSLKAQLRELQAQLAATDPDSAKYRELAAAAGELKDKIQDAAQAVGTQAGGAFERVGGSLGLVTSRIANLDFEGAAEGAKQLAVNIGQVKPGDIAKGIQSIGSAFASVGKALLTNPIFLIGAAIAAAIVYSEELLSLIDGVTDAETERLNAQKESAAQSKEQLDAISQQENILRLAGKTEREILDIKIKAAQQAIIDQKAVIESLRVQKEQQIAAAERNRDILKGLLNFVSLPITALLAGVDILTEKLNALGFISNETFAKFGNLRDKFTTSVAELVFDPAEVAKEGDDALKEAEKALKNLENQQAGFQLSIKQMNQKAADDRKAARDKDLEAEKKAAEELAAQEEALFNELLKSFEDAEQAKTETALKEQQKRLQAAQQYYDALAQLQDSEYVAGLTAQEKEELAISQKYENLIALAEAAGLDTTEITKKWQDELAAVVKAGADTDVQTTQKSEAEKVAIRQESFQKGLQLAQSAISVLQAFSDASTKNSERDARRKFKTDKALAIGAATVQTASAVTGALTAGGNPIKLATGQQFFEAAIAGALGLAQIIKIKNSTFGGTGGNDTSTPPPSVGGGGGAEAQPAQFNPLASQFIQDRPEQLTPRAFVLAGDVASQQEVREKVQDLARLG